LVTKPGPGGKEPSLQLAENFARPRALRAHPGTAADSPGRASTRGCPLGALLAASGASLCRGRVRPQGRGRGGAEPSPRLPPGHPSGSSSDSGCAGAEPGAVSSPGLGEELGSQGRARLRSGGLGSPLLPVAGGGSSRGSCASRPRRRRNPYERRSTFSLTWRVLKTCFFLFF